MSTGDLATLVVAGLALTVSLVQWAQSQKTARIKLLLGEKETAGYEAFRISRRPHARMSSDVIHALILVALFEKSDRARIQVYRSLDALRGRYRLAIIASRAEITSAAVRYRQSTDQSKFIERLGQLDRAVPWIVSSSRKSPPPPLEDREHEPVTQ